MHSCSKTEGGNASTMSLGGEQQAGLGMAGTQASGVSPDLAVPHSSTAHR